MDPSVPRGKWTGKPQELDVEQVAKMNERGDEFLPIFAAEGGHTTTGGKFRAVSFPDGFTGIELVDAINGRAITDLIVGYED
jgi:hypothetical protein